MNEDWALLRALASRNSESSEGGGDSSQQSEESWKEKLPKGYRTSTQLRNIEIKPRIQLFDDWCLAGDLGFIFAPRGLGKTWLTMNLAHGAATGTNVGRWITHLALKVLYLDGEMSPQDLKARDHVLGHPTDNLIYCNHEILFQSGVDESMNLANYDFQEGLFESCRENGIQMLCLDNLSCLASGIDENKSIDWERIQPWLLKLRRVGITVIFIHHAGRSMHNMRGSSKREDPAAWIMRLEPPVELIDDVGAHFITTFTKWRCESQPKSFTWTYTANGSEVDVTCDEMSTMGIFRAHVASGLDTCSMIAEEMGCTLGYVSRLAKRAEKDGWLEVAHRKYKIVNEDPF